jgi:hypothetical protein
LRDQNNPASASAQVLLTPAMREAIDILAKSRRLSRADIIRQSMLDGISRLYPEFMSIYQNVATKGVTSDD